VAAEVVFKAVDDPIALLEPRVETPKRALVADFNETLEAVEAKEHNIFGLSEGV
jgi:hypothetical protein